jgi:hypothetical protein
VKIIKVIFITLILYVLPAILMAQDVGWSQKESMPTQVIRKYVRDGGAMTAVFGTSDDIQIVAFRGYRSREFYKYGNSGWSQLESLPYGINPSNPSTMSTKKIDEGSALCWDGDNIIYATKGNGTTEFWAYYIAEDTWVQKAFVPSERGLRGGTSLAIFNGKIYLLAGEQSQYAPTNFFAYDPTADTLPLNVPSNAWTPLTSAPLIPDGKTFRDGSCICLLGDNIFALKGKGGHNYFWAYDAAVNTWTQKETIPLVHPQCRAGGDAEDEIELSDVKGPVDRMRKTKVKEGGAITTNGSVIYAIKGGGSHEFWKYIPGSPGHWLAYDTIPRLNRQSVPKHGAALAFSNGKVYLLKGNNTPEFWQYIPATSLSAIQSATMAQIVNINDRLILHQNFPNPFRSQTIICYSLLVEDKIAVQIFNVSGKSVKTLVNANMKPGIYNVNWDGTNNLGKKVVSGVYFYSFKTNNQTIQKKMMLMR